jgi:hypothetical protein
VLAILRSAKSKPPVMVDTTAAGFSLGLGGIVGYVVPFSLGLAVGYGVSWGLRSLRE